MSFPHRREPSLKPPNKYLDYKHAVNTSLYAWTAASLLLKAGFTLAGRRFYNDYLSPMEVLSQVRDDKLVRRNQDIRKINTTISALGVH